MDDSKAVLDYFENRAVKLDCYYLPEQKPLRWKILDFVFRKSIAARFKHTINECSLGEFPFILDVGCGSGRCAIALAERGLNKIVGIDFSKNMIKRATKLAVEHHVKNNCEFILGEFGSVSFNDKFNACLALGFFDYIKKPEEYLQKMKDITMDKLILSFPAKWRLRNIIRIIRLKFLRCPVYFYSLKDIRQLFKNLSIERYQIKNLGRDYLVIAELH